MTAQTKTVIPNPYSTIVVTLCAITILIGFLTLIGWTLDILYIKKIIWTPLRPFGAMFMIFSSVALLLLQKELQTLTTKFIANIFIAVVFLGSLITILDYFFQISVMSSGISFWTAINFLLLSISLFLLDRDFLNRNWLYQISTMIIILSSLFSLLGYIFNTNTSYSIAAYTRMGVHTSFAFFLLCIAILLSRPEKGIIKILLGNTLSGIFLRRIPIYIFLISGVLAIVANEGHRIGLYDDAFGDMLTLIGSVSILTALLWINASMLSKEEDKRLKAEFELNKHENLTRNRVLALKDISQAIESGQQLEAIAAKLIEIICTRLDWDIGEIWLVDKSQNVLNRYKIWHTKNINFQFPQNLSIEKLNYGSAIQGRVWQEKKLLWYLEPSQSPATSAINTKIILPNTLAAPILYKGDVLGVISLYSHANKKLDTNTVALIEGFGIQLGEYIAHQRSEEKVHQIEEKDILTGLITRKLLEKNLNDKLRKSPFGFSAVIIFDIDKFKYVNEIMGYDAGDLVLKTIVNRLTRQNLTIEALFSRLIADKFVLVPKNAEDMHHVIKFVDRIFSLFKEPFYIKGKELRLTPSIGISFFPKDGDEVNELLQNADAALKRAKKEGGNNFQIFTGESPSLVDRLTLENELRQAIVKNELVLYYQPKVDLKTGRITGVESLIRWHHPDRGLLLPDFFMPLAEETGLVIQISEWVINEICRQIAKHTLNVPIAINLSVHHFKKHYNLIGFLEKTLKEFSISSNQIELEITETVMMAETQHNLSIIAALKNLGFQLTIDDFGTGFSSLSYLKKIAADKIKLDKSFIDGIPNNVENVSIVRAILTLFHTLGKKVIAEGVETLEQLQFLAKEGCDEIQGYYFSPPVTLNEIKKLIEHGKKWKIPSPEAII